MSRRRRKRNACLAAIERIRRERPDLRLNDVIAFLYVCENEGIAIRELAELTRFHESMSSRAAARLAATHARSDAALGPLVQVRGRVDDRRGSALFLTELGISLRREIDGIIARAQPIVLEPS
jgi:hypothetical protein